MGKKIIILFAILLFAFILRFIFIDQNPPSMHADEADTGYTAFSLLKTGHDPYGNVWPLQFQNQANNYRSPLYTYSVIPFVALFGLNPLSTRFPSILYGVGMVLVIYFIAQKMFRNFWISFVAALLLAINPWSIHLSRTGLEVNLSVFLSSLGFLFFLYRDKYRWLLPLSAFIFGLSLFAYHPNKIFVPLLLIFLITINYKEVLKNKIFYFLSSIIFLLFFGVVVYLGFFSNGNAEFNAVSIFNRESAYNFVNYQRTQTKAPISLSSIFANKPVYYAREFINKYIGPLSVNYLFVNGEGSLDKGIGNYGQYHLFEIVPFVLGLVFLWKKSKKYFTFLIVWFALALIPGGITKTGYYAYRDVNAMIPPILMTSIGVIGGTEYFLKKKSKYILYAYGGASIILFAFFIYNYFFSYPVYARDWWAYSQKQVLQYIQENKSKYSQIYIQGGMDWNVLYAFYNAIDPRKFQESYKNRVSLGDQKVVKIMGIYIGALTENESDITKNPYFEKNSLLIVPGHYFPKIAPIKSFYSVDGVHVDINAIQIK